MRSAITLLLASLSLTAGCSDAGASEDTAAASIQSERARANPAGQRGGGAPYEVLGSQVWDVPDPVSNRQYQVFVQLPPSYGHDPNRRYPVLYVTDADYAFPVIRQISRRVNSDTPRIEEFILVGLSYSLGDDPVVSRRRDYTAMRVNGGGGGSAYQTYLKTEVLPFIERQYRANPQRRFILGHSLGGLLGAQILFSEPSLFAGYVLGSPSLWHGDHAILAAEAAYASSHQDLPAKVYMYIGDYEIVRPGPRYNRNHDMVGDNRRLEERLRSRSYPSLTLTNEVLQGDDHLTVAPRGFTNGLAALLPAQ